MDCTVESTPYPDARAHMSTHERGGVIQDFEIESADDTKDQKAIDQKQQDMGILLRSEGAYSCPTNPWPRDLEAEANDMALLIQKRKPMHRRQGQGNRWDQYGESSSATSSEAHVMSEKAKVESNLGPWSSHESGKKSVQPDQPYRLQQANRSDGQWSKWAGDVRQSQPDKRNSRSSRWRSSACDERAWKYKSYESSEWDGSKWSAPTSRDLGSPDYDAD